MRPWKHLASATGIAVLSGAATNPLHAQSIESEVPARCNGALPAVTNDAMPDVPEDDLTLLNVPPDEHKPYSIKWGIVALPAD